MLKQILKIRLNIVTRADHNSLTVMRDTSVNLNTLALTELIINCVSVALGNTAPLNPWRIGDCFDTLRLD